jgi:hypothetical protein
VTAVGLLVFWMALLFAFPGPDGPYSKTGHVGLVVDRWIFHYGYDPAYSTLNFIAIVAAPLTGFAVMRWFRGRDWSQTRAFGTAFTTTLAWLAATLGARLNQATTLVAQAEASFARLRALRVKNPEARPRAEIEALRQREVAAQARVTEADSRVAQLTREIEDMAPDRRMYRLIRDRSGSADYGQHLGLVSLVRQDFNKLSDLLDQPTMPVDRIVLFIDDLDRCDPDRVVKVLEAVHLLLAVAIRCCRGR